MTEKNPYAAPLTGPIKRIPDDVAGTLRHRVFRNRRWFFFSPRQMLKHVRLEVERFVDAEVGVENVLTISETPYPVEIVVWYRAAH